MSREIINTFIDLDETLIHTLGMVPFTKDRGHIELHEIEFKKPTPGEDYADTPVKVVVVPYKATYYTVLRPGAKELLFALKEIGHVYMLTRAAKDYANTMNRVFNFGFTEDKIFDREYVKNWKYKTPKLAKGKNFLIDDLDVQDNFEKIAFIKKYGTAEYIKVKEFDGYKGNGFTQSDLTDIINTIKS